MIRKFWVCILCITICCAVALQTSKPVISRSLQHLYACNGQVDGNFDHRNSRENISPAKTSGRHGWLESSVVGLATGFCTFVSRGMATTSDPELAELPPPYVPALFAVVLLAGVGLLTASLGDVLDEEASLGLQSGARAKKEIERSKSSYFKK